MYTQWIETKERAEGCDESSVKSLGDRESILTEGLLEPKQENLEPLEAHISFFLSFFSPCSTGN
jgi:hypothetical protein